MNVSAQRDPHGEDPAWVHLPAERILAEATSMARLPSRDVDLWRVDLAAISADDRRGYGVRLLQTLLGAYCGGLAPQRMLVRKTSLGAPYLPGAKVRFSLSHSAELLLIAVCRRVVGVDVERLRELPASRIAARFFSPMEQRAWQGMDDSRRLHTFMETWTRKEAYLKARGEGWRAPAHAVNVCADLAAGHIDHAADAFEQLRWRVFNFTPDENYVAALAVSSHPALRFRWFAIAAPDRLERCAPWCERTASSERES